jgi:hypothetical protein
MLKLTSMNRRAFLLTSAGVPAVIITKRSSDAAGVIAANFASCLSW